MAWQSPIKTKTGLNTYRNTREKGKAIEAFVAQYLEEQKFQIVERNFRCRMGEIDLIVLCNSNWEKNREIPPYTSISVNQTFNKASQLPCLIFLEVRFRKNNLYGGPLASIDWKKQRKLIRTAEFFLKLKPQFRNTTCRFDVIGVSIDKENGSPKLEWVKNAFQTT